MRLAISAALPIASCNEYHEAFCSTRNWIKRNYAREFTMSRIFGNSVALSNAQADPTVQPLVGWFSPSVDGTLISLINTATAGHPEREGYSTAGLAEQRFIALETLEKANVD